ncbi:glycosyltransferase [bacterium]|nr:MAG: glycosyltransferase [bacterium]
MARLKVFQVVECGGPGGTGAQVAALCRSLNPDRFETTLVYNVRPGNLPADYEALARPAACVRVSAMTREIHPALDLAALRELTKLFTQRRPDVVHAHSSKAGVLARLAAKAARVPKVFYSPRGYGFLMEDRSPSSRALYKWMERAASRIGVVAAVSGGEAELARREAWAPRVEVVPDAYLGAFPAKVEPEPHEGIVLTAAGRLTFARNPEAFARLAKALAKARPSARCVWLGDGELKGAFESAAEGAKKLELTGWLTPAEVSARLLRADVFVHFSRWEGLPNAVLEAMAHGLPVLASDVTGNRDIVLPDLTGLLAGDEDALFDAAKRLIDDALLRRRLGAAGRALIEREYTLPRLIERLTKLYTA